MSISCIDKLHWLIKQEFNSKVKPVETLDVYGPIPREKFSSGLIKEQNLEEDRSYFKFLLTTPNPCDPIAHISAFVFVPYNEVYEFSQYQVRVLSRLRQHLAQEINLIKTSERCAEIEALIARIQDRSTRRTSS